MEEISEADQAKKMAEDQSCCDNKVKQSKGERSRTRLLEAAAAEFASRGFHETKVSDIVSRAGLTQPSFYLYFANKEAAYDELVTIFRERLRELTALNRFPADIGLDEVRCRIRQMTQTLFDAFDQDRNLTEIGFFQCPAAEEVKAEYAGMISSNIREDQERGLIRRDIPAELLAQFTVGMTERIIRMKVSSKEREAHAEAMTAFISDALHAGCDRPSPKDE